MSKLRDAAQQALEALERGAWDTLAAEQQPTEGEEIMVNTPHGVFTLPLHPSGLSSGPRFVVHVPEIQRESVTVRYDLSPAQTESAIRDALIRMGWTPPEGESVATVKAERDAMLAAQQPAAVDDLIERLRALARYEHSDVSVAEEAADALEEAASHARVCSGLAEQYKSDPVLFAALTDAAAIIRDLMRGRLQTAKSVPTAWQRDEALLRQSLEALEELQYAVVSTDDVPLYYRALYYRAIVALRERLGEKA